LRCIESSVRASSNRRIKECLAREFDVVGMGYDRQKALPIIYKGLQLDCGYRIDFLVESQVVLELKSVDVITPIFVA